MPTPKKPEPPDEEGTTPDILDPSDDTDEEGDRDEPTAIEDPEPTPEPTTETTEPPLDEPYSGQTEDTTKPET
jgi:hypothetical protein